MFRATEAIEGMEKGYRDLQKPCQQKSAVFIVANLLYITYNAQAYDVKTGGYSADKGIL